MLLSLILISLPAVVSIDPLKLGKGNFVGEMISLFSLVPQAGRVWYLTLRNSLPSKKSLNRVTGGVWCDSV